MNAPNVIIIKKKGKGHGGGHGGAWKVAYADFVTAMMALFIVLWLLAQTDKELQKELSAYFRTGVFSGAPSILEGGSGMLDKGFVDVQPDAMESSLQLNAEAITQVLQGVMAENADLKGMKDAVQVSVTPEGVLRLSGGGPRLRAGGDPRCPARDAGAGRSRAARAPAGPGLCRGQ